MHGNINETERHRYRNVAYLSMAEAILILGGLLILIGFFMDWVSYGFVGDVVTVKGYEFGRDVGNYPETLLLPFIGILFIAGALFAAGRRRAYAPQKISRGVFIAGAWIAAIVAMFLSVYLTIRYSDYLLGYRGITIYNNLDIGWFVTISGNIILYIGCILATSAKARKLGLSDYYCVREDSVTTPHEKPATSLPHPSVQSPPVQPARPQIGAPVRPTQPPTSRPPQQGLGVTSGAGQNPQRPLQQQQPQTPPGSGVPSQQKKTS